MIIGREFKFEAAQFLPGHPKCGKMRGHTYKVCVEVEGEINTDGMVMDLHDLSEIVRDVLGVYDHDCMNNFLNTPTCENIADILWIQIEPMLKEVFNVNLVMVRVQEGEGGYAVRL